MSSNPAPTTTTDANAGAEQLADSSDLMAAPLRATDREEKSAARSAGPLSFCLALKDEAFFFRRCRPSCCGGGRSAERWWTPVTLDLHLSPRDALAGSSILGDTAFLCFRFLNASMMLGVLIASLVHYNPGPDKPKWWYFLTHWGLVGVVLYLLAASIGTLAARFWRAGRDEPSLLAPWASAIMALQAAVLPMAVLIVLMFWTLVYHPGLSVHTLDPLVHGLNGACMLLDLVLSNQPLYLFQSWAGCSVFGLCYTAFSIAHYDLGLAGFGPGPDHFYIYQVLDWSKPGTTAAMLSSLLLIAIPLVVLALWSFKYVIEREARGKGRALAASLSDGEATLRGIHCESAPLPPQPHLSSV